MNVEIRNYYKSSKDSIIKGSFTLVINPNGQKILFCKHFATDTDEWFSFPSNKITKQDKVEYIPYVCYEDKDYLDKLKSAVISAIKALPSDQIRQSKPFTKSPHNNTQKSWF